MLGPLGQVEDGLQVDDLSLIHIYSLPQIAAALEEAGVCDGDAFLQALQTGRFEGSFEAEVSDSPLKILKMEGYCFPDTYQFEKGSDPAAVAQTMLAHFDSQITAEMRARMDELGMSLEETVTLASIIQKESFTNEDMKQVSGVFHNRMAAGSSLPMLQSDVTIVFLRAYDAYGIPYTEEQSEAYNTYTVTGLPIGPVACPGKAALEAALWPASHDYLSLIHIYVEHEGAEELPSGLFGGGAAKQVGHFRAQNNLGLGGQTGRPAAAGGGNTYQADDLVSHKVFGRGRVLRTTPMGGDTCLLYTSRCV